MHQEGDAPSARGPDVQAHSDVELAPVLPSRAISCHMDCGGTSGPRALTLCIFLYKAGAVFAAQQNYEHHKILIKKHFEN